MAVKGNLKDISLSSLVSINCNEGNQACLRIERGDRQALVYFEGGNLIHASMDSIQGEEVLYEILRWEEGDFYLEQEVAPPTQSIHQPWSGILLEGMRRLDEWSVDLELEQPSDSADQELNIDPTLAMLHYDLSRIRGVKSVVCVNLEGEYFPSAIDEVQKKSIELSTFLYQRAKAIADIFRDPNLCNIHVGSERGKISILPHDGGLIAIEMDARVPVDELLTACEQVRERHA